MHTYLNDENKEDAKRNYLLNINALKNTIVLLVSLEINFFYAKLPGYMYSTFNIKKIADRGIGETIMLSRD